MTCEEVIKRNLGLSRCKLPGLPKGIITVPKGTTMTVTEFQTLADWNTILLDEYGDRGYLWPWFKGVENQSEAAIYEQNALASMKVRNGQYRWRFFLAESLCLHTKLYTHDSNGDIDVFLIDNENNIIGITTDAGLIKGLSVDLINAENLLLSDGSVSTKSPVYISLRDEKELNRRGVMTQVDWLDQLYRIVDVVITDVAHTLDDDRTVDVAAECDGTPIQGLVAADFQILDANGLNPAAPTTAVEDANVPGRYLLSKANGFVAGGFITLVAPDTLSVKAYEVQEPLETVSVA